MRISILLLLFFTTAIIAQSQTPKAIVSDYLNTHSSEFGLSSEDISDFIISDAYETQHNEVKHIYVQQRYHGIPIYNAITSFYVDRNKKISMTGNRFIPLLKDKIVGDQPNISALESIRKAVEVLGIPGAIIPNSVTTRNEGEGIVLENINFSNVPVHVKKVYTPAKDGKIYLSWDMAIARKDNSDYISLRINALTGELVDKSNWTVYCDMNHLRGLGHRSTHMRSASPIETISKAQMPLPLAKGSYRVVALPAESPIHGTFQLLQGPANDQASPLGWHDNNTQKFTITRGNNVHAYADKFSAESPSSPEPDGGANLVFDFPYDSSQTIESENNLHAATTNLFYMNNMMHDILYGFGFDENAGNFQDYNFGKGGVEGDHVVAQAQDGGGRNNANFATPGDGSSPRMQMFLWDGSNGSTVNVVYDDGTSSSVDVIPASYGGEIPSPPIEAEAIIADDGSINPTRACNAPLQAMNGKVALIDRGTCEFGTKSLHAQEAGAIAVLVCGFDNSRVRMAPGADGGSVTIPCFYAPKEACDEIKLLTEGSFKLRIGTEVVQDSSINDGDFDNGVIAHEFSHGISNRLTGGPSNSGCLSNGEQMGEGWSDFFALALTHRPGDKGTDPRGIGNYVTSQPVDGPGIRDKPYSTDMSINDFTYFTARTLSIPHGLGSVWCMMLWEMYWALVDEYGYDADLSNKNSGNAIAIQLVVDGMKLQPCQPGFVDGRDAILLADKMNNNGVNSCLIWKAFAKRGLGYGANQGSSASIGDEGEKESYEVPPLCQNKLRTWKTMTELITAGENIDVQLKIANNKPDSSFHIVVKDHIPQKTSYVMGSANIAPVVDGNTLTWTFDVMTPLEEQTITYQLASDINNKSILHWSERIEDGIDVFDTRWKDISIKGANLWDVTDEYQHSGNSAFYIYSDPAENDQHAFMREAVKLDQDQPVIRFYHWYNLSSDNGKPAVGTVELSFNAGPFQLAKNLFFQNGFTGPIPYGTFVEPFYEGFYGKSDGFILSYMDLSDHKGEEAKLKLRFGNEDLAGNLPQAKPYGWVIDDIELIDMKNYNSEVCISAEGNAESCVSAPGKGTIVEVGDTLSAVKTPLRVGKNTISVRPNPARDFTVLKCNIPNAKKGNITVIQAEGKVVFSQDNTYLKAPVMIPTSGWSSGVYVVKVSTGGTSYTTQFLVAN